MFVLMNAPQNTAWQYRKRFISIWERAVKGHGNMTDWESSHILNRLYIERRLEGMAEENIKGNESGICKGY